MMYSAAAISLLLPLLDSHCGGDVNTQKKLDKVLKLLEDHDHDDKTTTTTPTTTVHDSISCTVPGAKSSLSASQWTKREDLCDDKHVWNYAELGANGFDWDQTDVRCKAGWIVSKPKVDEQYPDHLADDLCLDKSKVDQRQKSFKDLDGKTKDQSGAKIGIKMNKVIQDEVTNVGSGKMVHVIMRATAGMRNKETGEEMETKEWDNLATGISQYLEKANVVFKGIDIMPDDKEGLYAHKAVTALAAKCVTTASEPWCADLQTSISNQKLVTWEQGGSSMQIFDNGVAQGNIFPDETGLFSNMGNNAIEKQLKPLSKCFSSFKGDTSIPKDNFKQADCKKELKALVKHRHHSKRQGMPKLKDDALYVAFGTFQYPAGADRMNISNKMMTVKKALKEIKDYLAKTSAVKAEKDKLCMDGQTFVNSKYNKLQCMQVLVLQMFLEEMVENSKANADENAKIVFLTHIASEEVSWTKGLAENEKDTLSVGDKLVVFDVGSSSTKVFGYEGQADGLSESKTLAKFDDGNLLKMTEKARLLRI